MKLVALIPETERRYAILSTKVDVKKYFQDAYRMHLYVSNFETWAAMSLIKALFKANEICNYYREYNCNDSHFVSLGKYMLRKHNLI